MQLPLEELESQCALELKKLQELSPNIDVDSLENEETSTDEDTSSRAAWIAILPDVIKAVQEALEGESVAGLFHWLYKYIYVFSGDLYIDVFYLNR